MKWFQFHDMYTGGFTKTEYKMIYIQAKTEHDAINFFQSKFDTHPYDSACSCCGSDFSINESDCLYQLTAYERGCKYDNDAKQYIESQDSDYRTYSSLDEYVNRQDILVVSFEVPQ